MPKRYCGLALTGDLKGLTCTRDAIAFVTYFQDGSGGAYACAHHLQRAIEEAACGRGVGEFRLSIQLLGSLRDKIEKRRDVQRRRAERGIG